MNTNTSRRPNSIELQDLPGGGLTNLPLHYSQSVDPLGIGAEVFRAKLGQHRRSWRTIMILIFILSLLLIPTSVLGVLYGTQVGAGPDVVVTTTTQSTTGFVTLLATLTTTSLQPTTETSMVTVTTVTTALTTRRAKTTSVTAMITTSLFFTTTQTTVMSITTTTTASAPTISTTQIDSDSSNRCIPGGTYGGKELQDISSAYNVTMTNLLRTAVQSGLAIGTQEDDLTLALKSIFLCQSEDDLSLVDACQQGYVRSPDGISCEGSSVYGSSSSSTGTIPHITTTGGIVSINTSSPVIVSHSRGITTTTTYTTVTASVVG